MGVMERLAELGLELPTAPKPLAAYVPAVRVGRYVYTSGQVPIAGGELRFRGKVGAEIDIEHGYEAAKLCVLNALGAIKAEIGDLDKIERVIKVTGYVSSARGFNRQPEVVNGASELLIKIFGDRGKHVRSAVGVAELPLGASVEVEMSVLLKDGS